MPFFGGGSKSSYVLLANGNIQGGTGSIPVLVDTVNNIALGNGTLVFSEAAHRNVVIGDAALSAQYDLIDDNVIIGDSASVAPSGVGNTATDAVVIGSGAVGQNGSITIGQGATASAPNEIRLQTGAVTGASVNIGGSVVTSSNNNERWVSLGNVAGVGRKGVAIGSGSNAAASPGLNDPGAIAIGVLVSSGPNEIRIGGVGNNRVDIGGYPVKRVLFNLNIPVTAPNNILENTLATFVIPGNTLLDNGAARIWMFFENPDHGSAQFRVYANGILIYLFLGNTNNFFQGSLIISNNSGSQQNFGMTSNQSSAANLSRNPQAIDFTADVTIDIRTQSSVATGSIVLDYAECEVYGA